MKHMAPLFLSVAVGASCAGAVSIDVGRQLFVDDYLVESTQGVVRVYNHPVKAFDAPVFWPQSDLEREVDPKRPHRYAPVAGATSGGLWWDPTKKVFRLWYEAGWMKNLCYAESKDGVDWTRPDCGVVSGTNRVLTDTYLDSWSVFPDYAAQDPYANWRLLVSVAGGVTDNRLYTSGDGVAWTYIGDAGQSGDRTTMFYDPFRAKWVFSLRGGGPGPGGRNRSYWASEAFGGPSCLWEFPREKKPGLHPELPRPEPWLATDDADLPDPQVGGQRPQLYNVDAVAYESILLGMFEILHPLVGDNGACVKAGLPKITDLHFAYSRDGKTFVRPDRTAAIASSRWGSGKWDTGYLSPMGGLCVIRDERLWFYYAAMRGDARETTPYQNDPEVGWRRNGMHFNCSVGVATLRRDGFAGFVADGAGSVTTKPVVFSGRKLFVNAECRFGDLSVAVLDEQGAEIPGFGAADCIPLRLRDATKAEIAWKGGDLASLAGRSVRFRFDLAVGTLYSFWVSSDASGASGGYLAAGGPAYRGLRDLPAPEPRIQKNPYELPPASDAVKAEGAAAKARLRSGFTLRRLVGHRGDSESAPENTMPAFRAAAEKGFNIETDLYLTQDGVVFLTHDQRICRAGSGLPSGIWATNTTWKGQLELADAGAWKGPEWKGTKYPRLDDLLELAQDGRFIVLEVKDPRKQQILPKIAEAFARHPNVNPSNVILQGGGSWMKKFLPGYRDIACNLPRQGWRIDDPPCDLVDRALKYDPSRIAVWSLRWDEELVTKELVDLCHARGIQVGVWTVNDAPSAWAALGRGVDWVCTDRPATLAREMLAD